MAARPSAEALRALMRPLLEQARMRLAGAPPPPERSGPAAADEAPLLPYERDGLPPAPVIFAGLWGLAPAELEQVVESALTGMWRARAHPLFLTDCARLDLFRRHRALFEYLPPEEELARLAPLGEVRLYLTRRLELLCRKWRPVRIIAYGPEAATRLTRLAAAPATPAALRSLFDGPEAVPGGMIP